MEGGLLIHAAWLLSFTFIFFYRRYFETVAPRDAAFEALCASRPVLAALSVAPGAETELAAKLRKLAPRGELIATLGGWPWTHYVLRVETESVRGVLTLRIGGARVLRSHEARPPTVTLTLDALRRDAPGGVAEAWLHEGVYLDVTGRRSAPHGWRLAPGDERPVLEAWPATPPFARYVPISPRSSPTMVAPERVVTPSFS